MECQNNGNRKKLHQTMELQLNIAAFSHFPYIIDDIICTHRIITLSMTLVLFIYP